MTIGLMNRMASLAIRGSKSLAAPPQRQILWKSNAASSISTLSTTTSSQSPSANISHDHEHNNNTNSLMSLYRCRNHSTAASLQTSPLESTPSPKPFGLQPDGTIIAIGPDGTRYAIPPKPLGNYAQTRHAPKLKPHIVTTRLSALASIEGSQKNIRHSPWRLNLICQFAAGKGAGAGHSDVSFTVPEAIQQLTYCQKVKAPLLISLIKATANKAKQVHGLLPSQLEVAECFATHGSHLKRLKIMGRGRAGKMHRRHSHIRLVLREIDFPLKIMQCTSANQRKQWVKKMQIAEEDRMVAEEERREIEELERQAKKMKMDKALKK